MTQLPSASFDLTRLMQRARALGRVVLGRVRHALMLGVLILPLRAEIPSNDSFPGQWLTGNSVTVESSNVGATAESGEPSRAGVPPAASVWWTWVAPDDGVAIVETAGSDLDTVLAVYRGDSLNALTLVAENDEAPGLATSRVTFPATGGMPYRIVVDGYLGATGNIRLQIQLPVEPSLPRVIEQPIAQVVPANVGTNVTFRVVAAGSFPLAYEWRKDGVRVEGATNASFTLTQVTAANEGEYSVVVTNPFGSVTSSGAPLRVLAGLGKDAFAGRVTFEGRSVAVFGHNFGATVEPSEPNHGGVNPAASIWWSWTAPANGLVQLTTQGSTNAAGAALDTVLAVYRGTELGSLIPVVANDDEGLDVIPTSEVFFRAAAGTSYAIAVAGARDTNGIAATGFVSLKLEQSDDNDFFAQALEFPEGATTVFDDNRGATEEPGEPNHAGNPGGKSVWWRWTAPAEGTYALDTVGSSIDTVLAVYTGTSLGDLMLVGEDDNRSEGGASLVKFAAVKGEVYHFAVDGYFDGSRVTEGSVSLNLNPALELNDAFADRVTLSGQTNRVTASNLGAGKEPGEPNHGGNAGGRSVWWTWTAPITAPVVITTRDSSFDTALAVYSGSELESLTLIAENDDSDPLNAAVGSTVVFSAIAGQSYQIVVDGYRSNENVVAAGDIVLRILQANLPVPGGNDRFANRFLVSGQTNTVVGNNTRATREQGEPDHAGNDGGRSLWWSWIAPRSAPVRFDTVGSDFDTLLAVYRGSQVDTLTAVAADVRSAGEGRSVVTFEAVEGVEYQVAVDGFNDGDEAASGRAVLRVRQFDPGTLHANDDFEHASPISDAFPTVLGSNIGATRQAGEPNHGQVSEGRSVWWTWVASADGPVTVSTEQSEFDTLLAVYTGDLLNSLELVAENDDIDPGTTQSRVTFQATAGTEYRLAVDGYGQQIGVIVLSVVPSPDVVLVPRIQQNPVSQTRFAGGAGGGSQIRFSVLASGAPPLAYQWFRNGLPVAGATSSRLDLNGADAAAAGMYQVTITNAFGMVTSDEAVLTLMDVAFNNDFAQRLAISGSSAVVRGSLLGADKEPNEPHHGSEVGGRSVWWSWTAVTNGLVEVHTFGSSGDTLLGVYTGSALEGLTRIAENDDLLIDQVYASRVTFNATAGVEYQIAVDAAKTNQALGNVVLTLGPPASPMIVLQPQPVSLVEVTNAAFALRVGTLGGPSADRYQWTLNGQVIPGATNETYTLSSLTSAASGVYAVAVTNDFGGVVSSEAVVLVRVPPRLTVDRRDSDGRLRLRFGEPEGTVAADPRLSAIQRSRRFEVQHTTDLGDPAVQWIATPGQITFDEGQFLFEESVPGPATQNFYRVVELSDVGPGQ